MIARDEREQPVGGDDAQASAPAEAARTVARLRAYARLAIALADELEAATAGDAARRAAATAERAAAEEALRAASGDEAVAQDAPQGVPQGAPQGAPRASADDAMRAALDALEHEARQRAQEELLAGLAARARAQVGGIDPRVPAWGEYLPPAPVAKQLDVRR